MSKSLKSAINTNSKKLNSTLQSKKISNRKNWKYKSFGSSSLFFLDSISPGLRPRMNKSRVDYLPRMNNSRFVYLSRLNDSRFVYVPRINSSRHVHLSRMNSSGRVYSRMFIV